MITAPFDYHLPRSLPEALNLLSDFSDGAKLLAGGHSLLPMMKLRFAEPAHLIDLGKIAELKGITEVGNEIHIGAMTTEHELLNSVVLKKKYRCWWRVSAKSPIRRCATRAPSVVISHMVIRAMITPR